MEAVQQSQEEDNLVVLISMIQNPHIDLVTALEERLRNESLRSDGLLLAFGALASNTPEPNVEIMITTFLLELEQNRDSTSDNDDDLIHLLLAMGNTGSDYVVMTILNYVDYPTEAVQIASVRACLKFTHLQQVLDRLSEVLTSQPAEEVVTMVVHTLVKGYQYSEDRDEDTNTIADHPILSSLVLAVQSFNNTDLMMLISAYLQELGGEQANALMTELHTRERRGTDWDASRSEYNLVASRSSRQSDVIHYPRHNAYIWGNRFGINEANLKAAAGQFMGISNDYEDIKAYSKVYAEANVLNHRITLVDFEVLLQKNGVNIHGKLYAQIGSNVYINYDRRTTYHSVTRPLSQHRFTIFTFTFPVFIYVGTVNIGIRVYLGLRTTLNAEARVTRYLNERATATAAIIPQVSLNIEGEVSVELVVSS